MFAAQETDEDHPKNIRDENSLQMVKDVQDQGGLVIAGTDSPIIPYGFSLHLEMMSYAAAGLSNFEVLQTATVNAAKAMKVGEELGSVEPGYLADLLFLNANPLADIKNLKESKGTIRLS